MDKESMSLSGYLELVGRAIANSVPDNVWIRAEISELRVNANGHCYLTLVEKNPADQRMMTAKVSAIIWASRYRMLAPMFEEYTMQRLSAGMSVLVSVVPNFHEVYGFSLNIVDIDATFTLGDLARKRMDTIQHLHDDGIWDMNHDLPFPVPANRVAIISSASAAGYGDFVNQLEGNPQGFVFYKHLFPAIMQGDNAAQSVIDALDQVYACSSLFDVVVIIRGGGATTDMLAFDDYELAASCAQFPLPIVTGIGHTRDESVLDMVAKAPVKTPTAVAEFLIGLMADEAAALDDLGSRLTVAASALLNNERDRVTADADALRTQVMLRLKDAESEMRQAQLGLANAARNLMTGSGAAVRLQTVRLRQAVELALTNARNVTDNASARLRQVTESRLHAETDRLDNAAKMVRMASPERVLRRGFSITRLNGKAVRSADELKPGDVLSSTFVDGQRESVVR